MKVGILGGTFNPPHVGHLRLAQEVAYVHDLDRVIFVPCFLPPHKTTVETAPPEDRLEMTRRACAGNPLFEVSDVEIARRATSYTVNTLEAMGSGDHGGIFFILGADSLREIHTWKEYRRLFHLSNFIVVGRPGTSFDSAWHSVPDSLRRQFAREGDRFVHEASTLLIPSEVIGLDISSTGIRALVKRGRSIRYLVPESVRSYINRRKLYQDGE